MTRLNELLQEFNTLYKLTAHERMIYLVAILSKYFEREDIRPVIVGGLSVEIYTRNNYTTYDIDIIASGRDRFDQLLVGELGFKKIGRSWYHEALELSIEIPSNYLDGSMDKVVELDLNDGYKVYVIGIEDIIVHRLESAMLNHSKNPEWSVDYEWAKRMYDIHKDDAGLMDKEYIVTASSNTRVNAVLRDWMN